MSKQIRLLSPHLLRRRKAGRNSEHYRELTTAERLGFRLQARGHLVNRFVSGHDLGRAEGGGGKIRASAPAKAGPQGLKPVVETASCGTTQSRALTQIQPIYEIGSKLLADGLVPRGNYCRRMTR